MPKSKRGKKKTSPDIFGAVSAPLRYRIIKLLHVHNSLSYSEIMSQLELNPSRDAGKFAYHLRTLLKVGLIVVDKESKRYRLTVLGNTMIGFSQEIDEHVLREEGKLLVRTSRLAMEEFDRTKIAQALNREAGIPIDLSRKIAEETEERLLKLDSLHLTSPLIREFVNALLVEKGLQEYRHKHTRLGLPVYDITHMFEDAENTITNVDYIRSLTGKTVMRDYVLLNVLPQRVADVHLLGDIHLNNADSWIIKPDTLQHDLRIFLQKGYHIKNPKSMIMNVASPKTLESALTIIEALIHSSQAEVVGEQGLGHFNVFLAPFVKGVFLEDLRRMLRQFVFSLSYLSDIGVEGPRVSLGLDFTIPPYLQKVRVVGGNGETYEDYFEESIKILIALLDIVFEDDDNRPILSPQLAFTLSQEAFTLKDLEPPLLRAHELAAKYGTPCFVNSTVKWHSEASYFTNGRRLASDWTGDWELDTLRTGNLGSVVINLPRLASEFPRDDRKFLRALNSHLRSAHDALRRKYRAIQHRVKHGLLPFLSQSVANEPYLRMKNTAFQISVTGLNEATKMQTDKQIHEDHSAIDYSTRILGHLALQAKKLSWKSGFRINVSQNINGEASQRFAELDVKRYGWDNLFAWGSENTPYYTESVTVPLEANIPLEERLKIESHFHPLLKGGHLAFIELEEPERSPDALLKMSQRICQLNIGAFAYTRNYGYCMNCQKSVGGLSKKCPECKTVKNFIRYSRRGSNYLPIDYGASSQLSNIPMERKKYII